MQISISQNLCNGYIIRLIHIFAACNSHEQHLAIPKTFPELMDIGRTAADLNCHAAEVHY